MPDKTVTEFVGIPSGDYEGFCWDVDRETFVQLTGCEPQERDRSHFHDGRYRFYGPDFEHRGKPYKVRIELEMVEEPR